MVIVAKWNLNGNTNDSSGNGYNGTPSNISYADGKDGQSAVFNGSNSKIDYGNITAMNFGTGDFIINCNVKFNSIKEQGLVSKSLSTDIGGWAFVMASSGRLNAFTNGGGSYSGIDDGTSPILSTGRWYTVGWLRQGTTNKIFLNGSIYYNKTLTLRSVGSTATVRNGTVRNTEDKFLDGNLDEVIVDNRAWSDSEFKNKYAYYNGFF